MLKSVQLKVLEYSKLDSLVNSVKSRYSDMNSSILNSIDPNINNCSVRQKKGTGTNHKDPISEGLLSLNLIDDIDDDESKSVLLLDEHEKLRINSENGFLNALNINPSDKVKVVSIFGNTGEGKSFTMNNVFFDGENVFKTSSSQSSCTMGVWAKYDPKRKVICLDTEGFLGISKYENERTRLLLKVIAVSDIIIYRTRAERLQRDMYTFLGGASKAYKDHFSAALEKIMNKSDPDSTPNGVGPGVIIFHETRFNETLLNSANVTQSAEDILRSNFSELGLSFDAFSFIKYVGIKTVGSETCFKDLKDALFNKLESTEVRTKRNAKFIYLLLKSLNEKFHQEITDDAPQLYLPAFFTCSAKCQSCKNICSMSMGHKEEGEPHECARNCTFQHQYQNFVFLCKACHSNGVRTIVKRSSQSINDNSWSNYLNYVWSGYVIECPKCGEIYRSRQHWYGNKNPEEEAVRTEIVHIWPGENINLQEASMFGYQNSAQKVLDGVTMFTDAISHVGSQPKKFLSDWAADKIAPSYWRPNNEIKECFICKISLQSYEKHHCRSCGEGFCNDCSLKRQPVPSRGWFNDVRVCNNCYTEQPPTLSNSIDTTENRARQIGETVLSSISAVTSVLDIPKEYIKESARPSYWTPDNECLECWVCTQPFGLLRTLHHCRECGRGVCNTCSTTRKPVPLRGWHSPVRVCNKCR